LEFLLIIVDAIADYSSMTRFISCSATPVARPERDHVELTLPAETPHPGSVPLLLCDEAAEETSGVRSLPEMANIYQRL
jgi:hypothetical protein